MLAARTPQSRCVRTVPSLKGLGSNSHSYPGLAPGANINAAAARLNLRKF